MATRQFANRRERRWYLFHKKHDGNNRKNTNGRLHQVIHLRDEEGRYTGHTKLIRHKTLHIQG